MDEISFCCKKEKTLWDGFLAIVSTEHFPLITFELLISLLIPIFWEKMDEILLMGLALIFRALLPRTSLFIGPVLSKPEDSICAFILAIFQFATFRRTFFLAYFFRAWTAVWLNQLVWGWNLLFWPSPRYYPPTTISNRVMHFAHNKNKGACNSKKRKKSEDCRQFGMSLRCNSFMKKCHLTACKLIIRKEKLWTLRIFFGRTRVFFLFLFICYRILVE